MIDLAIPMRQNGLKLIAWFKSVGAQLQIRPDFAGNELLYAGVIPTDNQAAKGLGLVAVPDEGRQVIFRRWEEVGVIVFNIGNNADFRRQPEEHVIVLISFNYQQVIATGVGIAAQILYFGPEDVRRVLPQSGQQGDDHAGGGGFAVGACYRQDALASRQNRQEISALYDRNSGGAGRLNFGVIILHGRRAYDQVGLQRKVGVVAKASDCTAGCNHGKVTRGIKVAA